MGPMKSTTLLWRRRRLVAFLRNQATAMKPREIWEAWAERAYPRGTSIQHLRQDIDLLSDAGYVRWTDAGCEFAAMPPNDEPDEWGKLPRWATSPTPFQEAMAAAAAAGTPWPEVARRFGHTRSATSDAVARMHLWRADPTPVWEADAAYQRWAAAPMCQECRMPFPPGQSYFQKRTCRSCERHRSNERMRCYLRLRRNQKREACVA